MRQCLEIERTRVVNFLPFRCDRVVTGLLEGQRITHGGGAGLNRSRQGNAQAEIAPPVGGFVPVAVGGPRQGGIAAPATAAPDAILAARWAGGIHDASARVIAAPVQAPFGGIP